MSEDLQRCAVVLLIRCGHHDGHSRVCLIVSSVLGTQERHTSLAGLLHSLSHRP